MTPVSKRENVPIPDNRTSATIVPQSHMVRGYAVISMIVPSNFSRMKELQCRLERILLQFALQVLNGNLLTDRQPLVAVRAEVDAGEVAAQGGALEASLFSSPTIVRSPLSVPS